ncbi:MAG: PEP-CTERM sorting domain-containing protein [Betaproteobacteria bacterium]|nr:PEP-CTERM sorting domain-containing protein [Betaproteobacteria bacterium]
MKTFSKLLATSIFALTASASQATTDVDIMYTWETNPDSFLFLHGDFYPHENHTADAKHNNKYKMWDVAGQRQTMTNPPNNGYLVSSAAATNLDVVRWGYGGWKKGKEIDFTRKSGSDDYRTSGLVINNGENTITYWNNFLDEDFYTPAFVTLNFNFTVDDETVVSPLSLFFVRENEKQKKSGKIDVDHGGSYLIFDSNLTFTHNINGFEYVITINDVKITDYKGNDVKKEYFGDDCGFNLDSCYIVGGKIKKNDPNTMFVISFDAITTPPPGAMIVPEPDTYAMLLAGLSIVGIVARRRRSTV